MNITLSEKDLENLSNLLVNDVTNKVLHRIASDATYAKAKERGELLAAFHMNSVEFSVADSFERILRADGGKMLKDAVNSAIRSVVGDDSEVKKVAQVAFAKHMIEMAEDMIDRYRDE